MNTWGVSEEKLNEAKAKISDEFIRRYYEWHTDIKEMSDHEYGMKYGYRKPVDAVKDNLKAVTRFQKYMYNGRWLPDWEKEGYEKHTIWALSNTGWLSYQFYSNWNARATGRTDFYYISQALAKQIYRDHKKA